jgi:uncharacterized membrane protein YdjX (TVP38/TMEM64 family)
MALAVSTNANSTAVRGPATRLRPVLLVIVAVLFVLAAFDRLPSAQEADDALLTLRRYDDWAWAAGILLIIVDVVLPIPQTAVISALGMLYGTMLGALFGAIGLIAGGLLGYGLMFTAARGLARRAAARLSLDKLESLFERRGAWAIVLTRSLPYSVPEAMVFLAGIAGMPRRTFVAALAIGSAPTALGFAAIGAGWADRPSLALVVSYGLPILLLPGVLYVLRRRA